MTGSYQAKGTIVFEILLWTLKLQEVQKENQIYALLTNCFFVLFLFLFTLSLLIVAEYWKVSGVCARISGGLPFALKYFRYSWFSTAKKMKFSMKYVFGKCDQIRSCCIFGHLLKKSLMENFIFLCSARFSSDVIRSRHSAKR